MVIFWHIHICRNHRLAYFQTVQLTAILVVAIRIVMMVRMLMHSLARLRHDVRYAHSLASRAAILHIIHARTCQKEEQGKHNRHAIC